MLRFCFQRILVVFCLASIGATGVVQMLALQNAWEEDGKHIGCHSLRGARLGPPCAPMNFFSIFRFRAPAVVAATA